MTRHSMSGTGLEGAASAPRALQVLDRYRPAITDALRDALVLPGIDHVRLMRYQLGWEDERGNATDGAVAGKLLRPALCLLCCEALGARPERALPAAVAVELVHNFSLIHDDIEDASETRHGRPTLWKLAGVPFAINAGDGMFVLARRALLGLGQTLPAERTLAAVRALDDACVALCEGQHVDLSFEARDRVPLHEYQAMIRGKSAALLACACELGALAAKADASDARRFADYGLALGLAFQLQDDVLGIWGEPDHTGKNTGDDVRRRKKSFPVIYAHERLEGPRRDELAALYARPSLHDREVLRVIELLTESGAREAAQEEAAGRSREAIAALQPLDLAHDRRADLEALALFASQRDR